MWAYGCFRCKKFEDQGIGLSEPMNWEHVSELGLNSSFKAFGSALGFVTIPFWWSLHPGCLCLRGFRA